MTKSSKKSDKTLLKKLMAGASALAVVTGVSTQAVGANRTTTGNGFVLQTGNNLSAVFNDNDRLQYTGAHTGSTGVFGAATTIERIIIGNNAPGAFSISAGTAAITISAGIFKGGGGVAMPIVLENGTTLILEGANVYAGLASIEAQNNDNGTLQITGDGFSTTATLGAVGNAINLIELNTGGTATFGGAVVATKLQFLDDTTLNLDADLTGDVDFNNQEGTLNLYDGGTITGQVDSVANGAGGNLIFAGDGEVTAAVGANNALTLVQLNGDNTKAVVFQGAVKATTLDLTGGAKADLKAGGTISTLTIANGNSTVEIGHGGGAATLTFDGNVQAIDLTGNNRNIVFAHANSVLRFESTGSDDVTVTLDAALDPGVNKGKVELHANNANSTLTIAGAGASLGVNGSNLLSVSVSGDQAVRSNVPIFTDTIAVAAGSRLDYAPGAAVSLNAVTFADAASTLGLVGRAAPTTFTLLGHVNPGGNGQGIVILDSTANNVTLTGNGLKTLGTNGNHIVELRAIGANNTVTATVDLTNVNAVNVKNGGTLASQTKTIFTVPAITIGEDGVGGGTLVVDSQGAANIDVLDNGATIVFDHADSLLKLTNTTNANHATFTLHANLAPGGAPDDLKGKLEIDATGTKTITIAKNAAETIGQDGTHRLAEFKISGDQDVVVNPNTFAKNLIISNTAAVTFGGTLFGGNAAAVPSSMSVTAAGGDITLNGNTTYKSIDFGGVVREVHLANLRTLTASTITNGGNTILTFDNNGALTLVDTKTVNLSRINAGAAAAVVTLNEGTYTVTDIQMLNNGGTIKLGNNFVLNGGFNVAGGANGTVKFLGNATVNGVLGGAGNALGAVTVAGASTLQLKGSVNVASLDGVAGNAQTLKFINDGNITVTGGIGGNQPFNVVEFNGANKVQFQTAGAIGSPTLRFSANADVVTNGFDLAGTNITQTVAGGKLTVNVNQTLTGNIAAFGTLHVDGNKNIDINTAAFTANITTENNDEVTINFGTNGIAAGSVGTGGEKFMKSTLTKTSALELFMLQTSRLMQMV